MIWTESSVLRGSKTEQVWKAPRVSHEAGPAQDYLPTSRVRFSTSTNEPNFVKVGSQLREFSQFGIIVSLITRRTMKPERSITVSVVAMRPAVQDLGLYRVFHIVLNSRSNWPTSPYSGTSYRVLLQVLTAYHHNTSLHLFENILRMLEIKQRQVDVNINILISVHHFTSPWSSG